MKMEMKCVCCKSMMETENDMRMFCDRCRKCDKEPITQKERDDFADAVRRALDEALLMTLKPADIEKIKKDSQKKGFLRKFLNKIFKGKG